MKPINIYRILLALVFAALIVCGTNAQASSAADLACPALMSYAGQVYDAKRNGATNAQLKKIVRNLDLKGAPPATRDSMYAVIEYVTLGSDRKLQQGMVNYNCRTSFK